MQLPSSRVAVLPRRALVIRTLAVTTAAALATVCFAPTARAGTGVGGPVHYPTVTFSTSPPPVPSVDVNGLVASANDLVESLPANGMLGPTTCVYYPPNYFDFGQNNETGKSDSTSTGNDFALSGTGGTDDSSILGGTSSGQIEQKVGEYVVPINFPPNSSVMIPNQYYYDGVLKTQANVSGVPFVGGTASSEASFTYSIMSGMNGVNSSTVIATQSQNSTPELPWENEVTGSGKHPVNFAITPNVSNVTYFDGADLVLEGSTHTAALTNAVGYAIFEGQLNGNDLYASIGEAEYWYFSLPKGYTIASC